MFGSDCHRHSWKNITQKYTLKEFQIVRSQIRSTFKDGNDASFSKAFVGTIFIEVEPALLLVIEEVKVLLGEFLLDFLLVFASSKGGRAIDADSFDIDSLATFAAGKNKKTVKKKLAKQDFDFLYDEKKGGLYFNKNGADKGFGEGGIIAILKGAPDLTSGNLEFI